jgi:C4-dicarboxylate transporter, DctM subunit
MFWTTLITLMVTSAATGVALGAALGLTGLVLLHFFSNGATGLAVTAIWNVFNSFTLSAVPLFILLGEILLRSGVSNRAYTAFAPVFRRVPGGLLHTNIAVCMVFGAVSGSSLSTAAAVGSVAYPEMTRRGYDRDMIVGSLAGGGTLGLLIPPSLSFLIYGALTETSIGRLFMAGILPGVMIGLMFMAYILVKVWRNPHLAPVEPGGATLRAVIAGFGQIWPLVLLILAVIGTIVGGIATPTEAAGLGVVIAVIITWLWGRSYLWQAGGCGVPLDAAVCLDRVCRAGGHHPCAIGQHPGCASANPADLCRQRAGPLFRAAAGRAGLSGAGLFL